MPVNFPTLARARGRCQRARVDPTYALAVLCMFRFIHPRADLRVAAGGVNLRSMQAIRSTAQSIFSPATHDGGNRRLASI